jgi:hypothetical protein
MAVQSINVGVWLRDLDSVYRSNTIGSGTVALLQLLTLQQSQAHELVASLADDAFVQRGIKGWRADYARAQWYLGWFVARLKAIVDTPDELKATRALRIWNDIAAPILRGDYTAELATAAAAAGQTGPMRRKNGRDWTDGGKDFGQAYASATLWNQAAAATDLPEARAPGFVANALVAWLTEVAHQLETSAPGEDATLRDHTVKVLRDLAAAPAAILAAAGVTPTVLVAGGVLALLVLLVLLRR